MHTRSTFPAALFAILFLGWLPVGLATAGHPPIPVVAVATPAAADLAGFDEFVTSLMEEFKVPGLAVAAVKDGQLVLSKGYGYRDVEKGLPVTPRTLMAIGSNSKSFTVTLMGMLSDKKQLDWNAPVRKYLSDFQLHDDVATRLMTPTDLVDHRSGLPRHDAMWYGRSASRKEIYQRLRFLEPNASFRQRWQPNNLMFLTAGYMLEQMTGESWDDLVRDRIFTPLGMSRSNTSVRDSPRSDDYSLPYMEQGDKAVAVPFRNIDNVAPAGSINSSVEEMMRYIQMHIDQGGYGDKQLISKAMSKRMQSAHSATPVSLDPETPNYAELGPGGYGLGLGVSGYRGHTLVAHGGGIDGFISSMSWMPDDRIGVMVLSNFSGTNPVPTIVQRGVYDRLLGLEPVDWLSRTRKALARAEERRKKAKEKRAAERIKSTHPSRHLSSFGGTYEHPGYGTLEVETRDGHLTLTLDRFVSTLDHFHYDVFEIAENDSGPPNPLAGTRVLFASEKNGKIGRVMIPLESNVSDIVFKRKKKDK